VYPPPAQNLLVLNFSANPKNIYSHALGGGSVFDFAVDHPLEFWEAEYPKLIAQWHMVLILDSCEMDFVALFGVVVVGVQLPVSEPLKIF
jgi:hypothetical protein